MVREWLVFLCLQIIFDHICFIFVLIGSFLSCHALFLLRFCCYDIFAQVRFAYASLLCICIFIVKWFIVQQFFIRVLFCNWVLDLLRPRSEITFRGLYSYHIHIYLYYVFQYWQYSNIILFICCKFLWTFFKRKGWIYDTDLIIYNNTDDENNMIWKAK